MFVFLLETMVHYIRFALFRVFDGAPRRLMGAGQLSIALFVWRGSMIAPCLRVPALCKLPVLYALVRLGRRDTRSSIHDFVHPLHCGF